MLLEAGLKKDDDDKAARRWSAPAAGASHVSYEQWLKRLGAAVLSVWLVFALFYMAPSSPPSSTATTVATDAGAGRLQSTSEIAFPEETNFLVVGDYGTGSAAQEATADALKRFAAALEPRPAFVLSTGDQIYEHGCVHAVYGGGCCCVPWVTRGVWRCEWRSISSASDPLLKERFEKVWELLHAVVTSALTAVCCRCTTTRT